MAEFLEEIKVNLRFGLLYGAENKNPSAELYIFACTRVNLPVQAGRWLIPAELYTEV